MANTDKEKKGNGGIIDRIIGRRDAAEMDVRVNPCEIEPGDVMTFEIKITAHKDFKANKMVLKTREFETTKPAGTQAEQSAGTGTAKTGEEKTPMQFPHTHIRIENEYTISDEMNMREGEVRIFNGTITFPRQEELLKSGAVILNEWDIEIILDVAGGPDLKRSIRIPIKNPGREIRKAQAVPMVAPGLSSWSQIPEAERIESEVAASMVGDLAASVYQGMRSS